MTKMSTPVRESDIDRVRELASIGAGHASKALADLLGRPCRMRVPVVSVLDPGHADAALMAEDDHEGRRDMAGVFFGVDGGLGGVLALMIPSATRDQLVETLVGTSPRQVSEEAASSALREFGNILVSHVVSAMADTLGVAVFPSVPLLVQEDAPGALASLVALRASDSPSLRVETEISDRGGAIRGILIFVPDRATVIATPSRF
jgi:chemotaxis protein CheC